MPNINDVNNVDVDDKLKKLLIKYNEIFSNDIEKKRNVQCAGYFSAQWP